MTRKKWTATSKPPHFDSDATSFGMLYSRIGRRVDRPFMILATFCETSLGDLVAKVAFASTLKDQFDHARLIVRYNDFRPYSKEVISLSPNIDHSHAIRGETPKWLRKYLHDVRLWRPLSGAIKQSRRYHEAFYDFILSDSMANARTIHALGPATLLRIPESKESELHQQLTEFGLDQRSPFAVVHYRSSSYTLKGGHAFRNSDPDSYLSAVDHMINNLGCQVVQMGHPEMTPFPHREGLVDLSRIRNGFLLQAYAVSRARFMLGSSSGPVALGWAFNIPTLVIDATDKNRGWGTAPQLFLTHEIATPDGRALRNQALYDSGYLDTRLMIRKLKRKENFHIRKATGAEISLAATRMHAMTEDVTSWRVPQVQPDQTRPNCITWPPQIREDMDFMDV